jgi:4-aminobutyrate aminotransferase/(S)-3-amino-2-methylpropionate transaminase
MNKTFGFPDRRLAAVPRGVIVATPVSAARALNAEIWDTEGRRYIDFAGGIGVLNTGHRHPKIMAAVQEQLEMFTHTCFQVMGYDSYVTLAERLNALAPFTGPAKTILLTTGVEATENAIKIARGATGRSAVIAFTGAFHGRTLMGMALTGKVKPYKLGFGSLPGDIRHIPFPAEHSSVSVEQCLSALDFMFAADVDPSQVAAIIIEPVQGEGGFNVAPVALLKALRDICDAHGIMLIADEVQSGFARTGKMFAIEHSGVEPDLIPIAKSMGGGFPLSGVIGKAHIMDSIPPGGLGGTYGGSPIACAAALAVLDVIAEENLMERSRSIGEQIRAKVGGWATRNDLVPVSQARGLGGMVAFDILAGRGSDKPDGAMAKRITSRAFDNGLVLLTCGAEGQTLRILVPLTVSDEVLQEGLGLLELALAESPA